jgi:hypothetical protein
MHLRDETVDRAPFLRAPREGPQGATLLAGGLRVGLSTACWAQNMAADKAVSTLMVTRAGDISKLISLLERHLFYSSLTELF